LCGGPCGPHIFYKEKGKMENNTQGHSIDYDEICTLVGRLYLEMSQKTQDLNKHYRSVVSKLSQQSSDLIEENKSLRDEIENVKKEESSN